MSVLTKLLRDVSRAFAIARSIVSTKNSSSLDRVAKQKTVFVKLSNTVTCHETTYHIYIATAISEASLSMRIFDRTL